MGKPGAHRRCTKLPGRADAAQRGACRRSTYCASRMGDMREHLRVFDVDRAALRAHGLLHRSPSSCNTAMRTATPFATWVRITDCGPSATSLSISTSRFMGPGCITMASGRAARRRARVRP